MRPTFWRCSRSRTCRERRAIIWEIRSEPDSQNEGSVRVDHRLSDNSQLTLRYNYGRQDLFEPYAENQTELPGFGDYVFNRGHNALVQYLKTLSPRTINSVLVGFNRAVRQIFAQNYTTDVNKLWGVNYLPTVPRDFGYPGISVTGYSRVGDVASLPIDRADNTFQVADNLTLIRGAHSIKIGGELRDLQLNGYIEVYARGQIDFTGALTGTGIGDMLLGLPTLGIQSHYTGPQTLAQQILERLHSGRLESHPQPHAEPRTALRVRFARHRSHQPHGDFRLRDRPDRAGGNQWNLPFGNPAEGRRFRSARGLRVVSHGDTP